MSIDNMSPGNPFIKTLSGIPLVPGVHAHSIIPVKGDGPLQEEADGGRVYQRPYRRRRIGTRGAPLVALDAVEPETVDEVRRILLVQAEANPCAVAPPGDTSPRQPPTC